ncbi:similar to taurine catabolism dioxygenase TauD [Botrytis cinerea T4]|uniref:Similar to taurine catabolism dioxygenase TauD n=1 Tax=Botryotinia fuckeliana (strain T4) TaxID=999810 RepID=G2Y2C0_BOTF4|nr:similar to taurine catabolism dioxygenase TauD [Botrytis cinerea T4]
MHRIFRGSHTARTVAASHFPQTAPINVAKPSLASHASHLRAVHETLIRKGVLQLQLGFDDNESLYLRDLIYNLHLNHNHGLPITHSAERGWFWDVRPSPSSFQSNAHQARSETMLLFDWHTDCSYETDPPRFFALQVLQPDRYNGGTLSVLNVDRILTLLSPFARKWLSQREYKITVPPEFVKKGGERHIVGNLLAASGEEMHVGNLRFREDITVPLTQNASKALAELKDVLKNDIVQAETIHLRPEILPRGSIIMMDNRRWLHSRNEVKDPERHLRRVRWDATQFGAYSP